MNPQTIIVGGGPAGLACALRLHQAGQKVLVLEQSDRVGGNVRTDQVEGFLLERGPHTFMGSATDVFDLARDVGLEDQVVPTQQAAHKRYICRYGKLLQVPTGPGSFLGTRLLSFSAKLKLATEPLRTRRKGHPEETATQFFERRFGKEAARILAGAFISGVYAGDPDLLSARAAFPLFWNFEQESGSMIRGALRLKRQRKAEAKRQGAKHNGRKGLYSLKHGLGQLMQGIADKLGPNQCQTKAQVIGIQRCNHLNRQNFGSQAGFEVQTSKQTFQAPNLVLAIPPPQAATLCKTIDSSLSQTLDQIVIAQMAIVWLGYGRRIDQLPESFGFLTPPGENVRTLGVLFCSRLFPNRAPAPGDLLAGFIGGMRNPEALTLDDQALSSIVQDDLARLTGMSQGADFVQVKRYRQAIPQLTVGHCERISLMEDRLQHIPGLHLAGNYISGVGLKDAVGSGFLSAQRILEVGR